MNFEEQKPQTEIRKQYTEEEINKEIEARWPLADKKLKGESIRESIAENKLKLKDPLWQNMRPLVEQRLEHDEKELEETREEIAKFAVNTDMDDQLILNKKWQTADCLVAIGSYKANKAETLLALSDDPTRTDLQQRIDFYDQNIARLEKEIESLGNDTKKSSGQELPNQEMVEDRAKINQIRDSFDAVTRTIDTEDLRDKSKEMRNASGVEFLEGSYEELMELSKDKDFWDKFRKLSKILSNLHLEEKK